MISGSSKRRRRRAIEGSADRINLLSDCVLDHIISFVPTKYAVAMSILSRRRKDVWTSQRNLTFEDRERLREPRLNSIPAAVFANFVNTVLRRTYPAAIEKFYVHWSSRTLVERLNSWVSTALIHFVREIELFISQGNRTELPLSIYTAPTLEVLKLNSPFSLKVSADGKLFPSLKVLRVVLQ